VSGLTFNGKYRRRRRGSHLPIAVGTAIAMAAPALLGYTTRSGWLEMHTLGTRTMHHRGALVTAVVAACGLAGCVWAPAPGEGGSGVAPLPVQQQRVYPETVTGRFVSLADFEDSALTGKPGRRQVDEFTLSPGAAGGSLRYVVNITRTGVGALEATIPPGASLVWQLPQLHDFSPYALMMFAIYSRQIRDDLKIVLVSDAANWQSRPLLLKRGWNDICIDIQRLMRLEDFDGKGVRAVRFSFGAAAAGGPGEPVRIHLDDVMLIDNRRQITPTPSGMKLFKTGLDYELYVPHRTEPYRLVQHADGLWRLEADQAAVEFASGEHVVFPAFGGAVGVAVDSANPLGVHVLRGRPAGDGRGDQQCRRGGGGVAADRRAAGSDVVGRMGGAREDGGVVSGLGGPVELADAAGRGARKPLRRQLLQTGDGRNTYGQEGGR